MIESSAAPLRGWRYGLHPRAKGMQIASLGRVELALGEALRLEMTPADGGDDNAHLQYYIATDAGPWALWMSCPRSEMGAREAVLEALQPPSETET